MGRDPDAKLVEACRRGERAAFESLLARYERPIYNVAFRMLANPEDARDVTQTTFLKVFERLDQFDARHRFFSWLYRIAINEALDIASGRNRLVPLEPDDERADDLSPPEAYGNDQLCARVQDAVMRLPPHSRTVIVLRHFAECSYRDMADILGIPEKTVKSRLFAARQLLRERLERAGLEVG